MDAAHHSIPKRATRRPDPALAALLNLIAPGSAFVYAGVPLLAAPAALATLLFVGGAAVMSCDVTGQAAHIAIMVWMVVIPLLVTPALGWWIASRQSPRVPRWFEGWHVVLLSCVLIVGGLQIASRIFVYSRARAYAVAGQAMALTLFGGEQAVGCAISQGDVPRRQVVAFDAVGREGARPRVLVARVVAGPGDTVGMQNYEAVVNGAKEPPGAGPCAPAVNAPPSAPAKDFSVMRVPDGQYFLLGDCRDSRMDSRQFGPVSRERIRARIAWIWFSPWSATRVGQSIK